MNENYEELPEELQSILEEMFRAGSPLTELQQIGRGPTIVGLAERLLRGEVKKLYESRRVGKTTVARGSRSNRERWTSCWRARPASLTAQCCSRGRARSWRSPASDPVACAQRLTCKPACSWR